MKFQSSKIKLYIMSGLGANSKVFDKIIFSEKIEPVFIDWLIPERNERFDHYILRLSEIIDHSEKFYLLGYSFGGMIVQEIHKLKPAKKIAILGSIKSYKERSRFFDFIRVLRLYKIVPISFFLNKSIISYLFFQKFLDKKIEKLYGYFTERDSYYLKWSIYQFLNWKGKEQKEVIQIMADSDIVFPIKHSKPDYIIKEASHLFPINKSKEVSEILWKIYD